MREADDADDARIALERTGADVNSRHFGKLR
jgi:hypothetical protein